LQKKPDIFWESFQKSIQIAERTNSEQGSRGTFILLKFHRGYVRTCSETKKRKKTENRQTDKHIHEVIQVNQSKNPDGSGYVHTHLTSKTDV